MLIYAAMVVALQSMSPSRQGIHVEAYCARLVVEGCDVPMQNHSGGQQSNRVPHEEDRSRLNSYVTLSSVVKKRRNWYAKETQFGYGNDEDQYAGHSLRSTLSVLNVWILTRYIWPKGAHVLLC